MAEFPEIALERVNVLEHPEVLTEGRIRRYPTLAHENVRFDVLFMTRGRIRRFLSRL